DVAGGVTGVEDRADLDVGIAVRVRDAGDVEIGAVIGSSDKEVAGARELEREGAALPGSNGLFLHVEDADASRRSGAGGSGLQSDGEGVPAIGGVDGESGVDGAMDGLHLELG